MKFVRKSSIREHVKTKHDGNGFECNSCSYKASQLRYLEDHKEAKHGGTVHSCERCDFNTKTESKWRRHCQKH